MVRRKVQVSPVGQAGGLRLAAEAEREWLAAQSAPTTDAHDTDAVTPCRVCGGGVDVGGQYWGPWREHAECTSLVGSATSRVLVVALAWRLPVLSFADAALVAGRCRVPCYADVVGAEPVGRVGAAWSHVDRRAVRKVVRDLDRMKAPRACTQGACAWCGTARATAWHAEGHTWPGGDPAPLCGDCHEVFLRCGSPSPQYPEDARAAISEAVTGQVVMLGEQVPAGLRGYAETVGTDHAGGEPWTHLDAAALAAYRWEVWGRFGGAYAPVEHRAEAVDRAARRDAMAALRARAVRAQDEAAADRYGF